MRSLIAPYTIFPENARKMVKNGIFLKNADFANENRLFWTGTDMLWEKWKGGSFDRRPVQNPTVAFFDILLQTRDIWVRREVFRQF